MNILAPGIRATSILLAIAGMCVLGRCQADDAKSKPEKSDVQKLPNRPTVPGNFQVDLRTRSKLKDGLPVGSIETRQVQWKACETAIIICDMWDDHYCKLAAQRVDEMAPRMNKVISTARAHGAQIIHAPSGTMKKYADTPYRKRMQQAQRAKPPVPIAGWCYLDPKVEPEMPVDVSKGACDDPIVGPAVRHFERQHTAIKIIGYDGISDNGAEIYNLIHETGIKNVVLMGVHTNMCVLGRPFGIRQMVRLGLNVAICRDLTDAMYDPRNYPFVSHTRGTELVVEHIETYWCPSIDSRDLTKIISGSNDPDPKVTRDRPAAKTTAK